MDVQSVPEVFGTAGAFVTGLSPGSGMSNFGILRKQLYPIFDSSQAWILSSCHLSLKSNEFSAPRFDQVLAGYLALKLDVYGVHGPRFRRPGKGFGDGVQANRSQAPIDESIDSEGRVEKLHVGA